jgi:hypothetical protein
MKILEEFIMFKSIMERINCGAKKTEFVVTAYRKDGSFHEFTIKESTRGHALTSVRGANHHCVYTRYTVSPK